MKKVFALSLVAVAALGLGACTPKSADNAMSVNETEVANDTMMTDDNAVDANAVDANTADAMMTNAA